MVEVVDAVRMVKQNNGAMKLIQEIVSGRISEVKPVTNAALNLGELASLTALNLASLINPKSLHIQTSTIS